MLYLRVHNTVDTMKRFFELPRFETEELNLKARIIYLISSGTIATTLIFVLAVAFVAPSLVVRATILAAIIIPACIGILILLRFSSLNFAGNLLLIVIWLAVTLGTITAGGVSAPILVGYLILITISRLISNSRVNLYVTLICIISGILIANAEIDGQLPGIREYSPIERVSIFAFFFVITMILQNIIAGNINQLQKYASESELRYKVLLERIPTITYINGPEVEAGTQYVSPQVEKLLGYSRQEFLDDPLLWTKIIYAEDRAPVFAENERTVKSGEPFKLEYRLLTKDERVIWIRDDAILVHNTDGTPHYWLGVWTDITTRKQAEEEQADLISVMTKRTIQLQTAAEVSSATSSILDINKLLPAVAELIRNHFDYYYVGIFLIDDSKQWAILSAATGEMGKQMLDAGHRLAVGDSSMIGWSILHGQARIALDVGKDAVRFRNPYLPMTRSEMALPLITHGEVIGAMTIQSEIQAAFSRVDITALQTMADQSANAIENARLFTERASLISELEARNAELERFTYTVSHDLRSPLVTMRGFLGYLRQDAVAGDMARFDKDIGRIANAVDRMQTLLNDLLELSRVGRIMNPAEDIPFGQIARDATELVMGPGDEGRVRVDIQKNLPTILGNYTRLVEVLQNLISNAIKFMGDQPEPRIEIGCSGADKDGKPILFVRDNGIGIEPQFHDRIFGLFNRLDPSIAGTGIGLTLVRRIIEVHGGRIWVESQPGAGATFLFTLPISESN